MIMIVMNVVAPETHSVSFQGARSHSLGVVEWFVAWIWISNQNRQVCRGISSTFHIICLHMTHLSAESVPLLRALRPLRWWMTCLHLNSQIFCLLRSPFVSKWAVLQPSSMSSRWQQ